MNGGGAVEIREAFRAQERKEFRRMTGRFIAAALLELLSVACKRAAGPDPNPTKSVAYSWALEINLWAHLSFTIVFFKILCAPWGLEGMRRIRQECDAQLLLGVVCLMVASLLIFACSPSSGEC